MFSNTGKGGWFFDNLYDWFDMSEIRSEPVSKDEFLKAGLSEGIFSKYIAYVKQLYGEYFLSNNRLATKYDDPMTTTGKIWSEFNDFCINANLIPEFSDENGNRMPVLAPNELRRFQFIYQYPQCPDIIHTCTLDEFRLAVEMVLANMCEDWYLDLRYNVRIVTGPEGDRVMRYDLDKETMVPLARQEESELLSSIVRDMDNLAKRMEQYCANPPKVLGAKSTRQEYIETINMQENWLREYIVLEREQTLLDDCYQNVEYTIQTNDIDDDCQHVPDDTLYIHKGKIVCQRNHHRISQATAVLMNRDGKDIQLNVNHCEDCKKFFLDYNTYQRYREKYGLILGNIRMVKNGTFDEDGYDLAEESPLRLCGYTVSQKAGLTEFERQMIIESCIETGAMTKESVIHLLNWFIEVNGAKRGNELAYKKWCADLDFTLAYNTPRQKHYRISKVEKYTRNRFAVSK